MFTVCVGLVFRSKYVQFPIICSLQYSININTVEVDPHSDLLYICIMKPENICCCNLKFVLHCYNKNIFCVDQETQSLLPKHWLYCN